VTSDEFRVRIGSDNEKYGKVTRVVGAKLGWAVFAGA
jgi:hypothetical protein